MSSAELKKDFDEDAEVWSGEDPLFDNNFKRCEKGGDSLFNFPYSDSELSFNESHGRRSTETDPDSYGKIYPE